MHILLKNKASRNNDKRFFQSKSFYSHRNALDRNHMNVHCEFLLQLAYYGAPQSALLRRPLVAVNKDSSSMIKKLSSFTVVSHGNNFPLVMFLRQISTTPHKRFLTS